MGSRMDKYNNSDIPKRSDKNKELYRQIYNAYDEFENLVVPSNVKEIDLTSLKKEITSRDEYKKVKDYSEITNNKVVRKELVQEEQRQENEIYDINELLNKAVKDKKDDILDNVKTLSSDSYLKRLKLDNNISDLEMEKDLRDDYKKDDDIENEELLRTANLSLDLLSDLRGDNDDTMIDGIPIDDEIIDGNNKSKTNEYKFSKKEFDEKSLDNDSDKSLEEDFYDDEMNDSNGKFFFKILLLIFGLVLVVVIILYLLSYFNRV